MVPIRAGEEGDLLGFLAWKSYMFWISTYTQMYLKYMEGISKVSYQKAYLRGIEGLWIQKWPCFFPRTAFQEMLAGTPVIKINI